MVIRLDSNGLIHQHKITLLQKLSKYPGSLVELRGSEDELQNAVDIYQVPCKEILNSLGEVSSLICRADDLLTAMEIYQSLSQRESSQFEEF